MPTEQQLKTLDTYASTILELMLDQIEGIKRSTTRQTNHNRHIYVRMFGQLLYEAPKLHTGMVSIRLIEEKLSNFGAKACHEHHHSRQKGGEALVALIDKAIAHNVLPTKQQVVDIALIYCQVHFTTAAENAALRKHQRRCSSEAAYRRSNIQLVEARDLFTKKGRHSSQWKQLMKEKYQPIVDRYNNPTPTSVPPSVKPLVIN